MPANDLAFVINELEHGGLARPATACPLVPRVHGIAKQIHEAVLATFQLSAKGYGHNQLRYDPRTLKGHGLLEREASRHVYRLTGKGVDFWFGDQNDRNPKVENVRVIVSVSLQP